MHRVGSSEMAPGPLRVDLRTVKTEKANDERRTGGSVNAPGRSEEPEVFQNF
jgi:hypothetical protein